ncbi:Tetraspanin-8 [Bienertia sinuspersici]
MKCSNSLVGILNFVTFLLSIPILGGGIWLAHKATTDCEKYLEKPVIILGVFLMVVSLAGLIGACCRVNWLLWVYLVVMFLLILVLFCFTIFALLLLTKVLVKLLVVVGIRSINLVIIQIGCKKELMIRRIGIVLGVVWLMSGCCKPPDSCKFDYVGPTNWTKNANADASNPDCTTWNNNPGTLCYDCTSCKAGFLQNLKRDWKKVAVINIVFLVFLIIVYSIGCCAFRNNRWDNSAPQWKPYR